MITKKYDNGVLLMGKLSLVGLRPLRELMRKEEKAVTVFRFAFNHKMFFVVVSLLTEKDLKKQNADIALLNLCFMKKDNLEDYLECFANSSHLLVKARELRDFLGLPYNPNGMDWRDHFYIALSKSIPSHIPELSAEEERIVYRRLCIHEKRDPNRTYRSYIFRNGIENGKQKHRTEFNGQLASYKFRALYPRFADDREISFAFTSNPDEEKTEEQILENFEKNEALRRKLH